MNFIFNMMIFMFAGAMNGSFALPTKHMARWSFDRIWLNFSVWAFLIFPCVFMTILAPSAWQIYAHASYSTLAIILLGGFGFAIGQICFSRALQMIGLSLSFVINISIGTALGSFIPLVMFHADRLMTQQSLFTMIGILCIIVGVLLSYFAGRQRDHSQQIKKAKNNRYLRGVFYVIIAGLFSAGQNVAFSLTSSLQQHALQSGISPLASANIMWPAFLIATFIPYASYMLYLRYTNQSITQNTGSMRYYVSTIMMGAFWFFSLILYSDASLKMGDLGPVIGWPLFMVCIILTANAWGWRHGEWKLAPLSAKRLAKLGIVFLILAIIVLATASMK